MFLATTQWSVWGECSVTCGGGIQSRTRDCSSGNQAECPPGTIYSEQRDCNDDPCPIGKFNPVKWVTCFFLLMLVPAKKFIIFLLKRSVCIK